MKVKIRYRASIGIASKVVSAEEVTNILCLKPSSAHEKGTPVSKRNPHGKLRSMSLWILESDLENANYLEEHIEHLISIIESKESEFIFLSKDCRIDIYCGLFVEDKDEQGSFCLSSQMLKRLVKVPLDLIVALYPTSE